MESQDTGNLFNAKKINEILDVSLAKCLLPIDQAWSLPPECYVNPHITALEVTNIFQHQWFALEELINWLVRGITHALIFQVSQ